jgi:hypothetical protein
MINTKRKARPASATGRAIIHTSKGRYNTGPSRKQQSNHSRLLAFKSRVVRAKLLAYRKSSRRAGGEPRQVIEPLEVHDLAKLPEMSAKEYAELRDDMARNGQLEPIILHEGKILDGYHRSKACRELGIPRKIETYKGTDPAGFVLSRNAYRRHLTADQRTALITKLRGPQLQAEAKARQLSSLRKGDETPVGLISAQRGKVAQQIAKESGVGRDQARKAIRLLESKPEVLDEVITGKRKLPAKPAKPRKPKPPVDKLKSEYIWKRFGMFLRHWPLADQRAVRKMVHEFPV